MALVVADRVQETSSTSGTGTLTLTGALAGYQTFSTAIGNGNTTFYTIYDPTLYDWEVGIGTVGSGTLSRDTVLSNSAGTFVPISFAGNSKFVFCTYPAEKSINYDANGVATIGEVLGYSDTGIIGSFASTVAGYNQVILQNKSTATNASSNFNVSNDAGTAGSNYAELGINSSTFTGSGSFNIAGASYVASASTDLVLGTYGAYNVHFVTNSNTTDAMTIFNDGGISLGGFANPGIANMAASKFVPGYTAVTSAAGTTVLTEDSNYYQNLLGTTTQTFQLPDATTLLVGTTFIFDNDSTGVLSIVDNASGSIDSIPAGGVDYVYLANNSTVAGTWRKHAFIPAAYDFNNSTASFGNATITNAVWNGTTIGTAYGGTGLTTFGSANYALYSTSSSALVAGTLPVAAGGSGATTFTANGVVYGNGTSPLGVTAAGSTGEVLVGNTGGAPSWATISSSLVSSFQTSLSGLTPSTATTGAVTLAGTLGATSGGTGLTSYTTGDIIYASATNTLSKLAAGTNGYVLTLASGVPSWAANNAATTRTVSNFTATASQTTFTVAYTVGLIDVYRNGVKLASADYTATNGTSVILATGANAGDIIETVAYSALSVGTGVDSFSGGTTGLTPAFGTGTVVLSGTLNVANGGTGVTTSTGSGSVVLSTSPTIASPTFTSQSTFAAGTVSLPAITTTGDTNTGIFFPAADTIAFAEGGTEAMRINSSGNVGIGTTSITNKLDVVYSSASTSGGVYAANSAASPNVDAVPIFANLTNATGTNSTSAYLFRGRSAAVDRFYVYGDGGGYFAGNVGIGTTSPSSKLTVGDNPPTAGAIAAVGSSGGVSLALSDNVNSSFYVRNAAGGAIIGTDGGNALRFATNGNTDATERMRIDSSGNVGIGNTPSGTYKLQVSGLISDSKGDVRAAPIQSKTSAYVLTATDAGQTISITTGGVTVNASVFSAGDMVSIFNNSGSSQTITQGASVTLRLSGTATTGSRTLAQYGVATLLCVVGGATPTFACTGAGLT